MKRALVSAMLGQLCQSVDINYGTTECGVIATCHVTDPALYEDGLTGPPAVGVEVRVVGEAGQDVAQGVTGQFYARSPALHAHYVDNPEAEEKNFTPDLWFRTDDVGFVRPDGQLVHLGRRSDAITRGAYLCYPSWLESLLRRGPGVKDVCVVPVPDPVLHHEICACVVPMASDPTTNISAPVSNSKDADCLDGRIADGGAALRQFADSLLLTQPGEAQHMTPKYYVMLKSLPLTPTGKVSRKDVAALALEHLGFPSEAKGHT
jgi:acyl-CoA synthetase (AMP-forming)/AMP-acid ligase II